MLLLLLFYFLTVFRQSMIYCILWLISLTGEKHHISDALHSCFPGCTEFIPSFAVLLIYKTRYRLKYSLQGLEDAAV